MVVEFDAFISYRRSDANAFARRLRHILQDFKPPRSLRHRHAFPLKVYLDTSYERATNDFFERVTLPALLSSRHLIVVATPDAADRGPDRNDWIRREIDAFEDGPNAGNIIAVQAKDAPTLPGDLVRRYPNIEIIDMRGLSALSFLNPAKAARLSNEIVKLLAPLLDLSLEEMPALRREEERRQRFRFGFATGGATTVVLVVAGMSILAFESRNRALDALSRSVFATDRVIETISGSPLADDARADLLATSCDLLDSLRLQASAQPGTRALVLCAIQRSKSRDSVNEPSQAASLIQSAISLAESQFAAEGLTDDALAVLEARRAALDRTVANNLFTDDSNALAEFVARSIDLSVALRSERSVPEYAATALQVAVVSLTQNKRMDEALTAVDAAIELRALALAREPDLNTRFDNIVTIGLKSEIHRLRGEPSRSSRAAAQARTLLSKISKDEVQNEGLGERLQAVTELVRSLRPSDVGTP